MNRAKIHLSRPRLSSRSQSSGQIFFKWLAIVAILAAASAGYAFFTSRQRQEAQLASVRAEKESELAKQNEELEKLRSENKEIERLRAESQEVVKLRGESAQFRALQKEQQKMQAENQQLRSTIQQLQQVGSENSTLRSQNQQLQGAIADRTSAATCVANLKTLEALKTRWAADVQKTPTAL